MKVVQKKLTDLHKIDKNVRRHSEKQISEYVRSLKMFGQIRPLVVDEDGMIIAGNGLYDALIAMQAEKADCYVVTGLSEKEKKKLMLADNRVYELGMTDTDAFDEIIKSLEGDIDVPGWDADLLETLNATIGEVNELVDSYGAYEPSDVDRMSSRPEPIQGERNDGSGTIHTPEAVNTSSAVHTQETPIPPQRTITCPKCGEVIQIGGV